MVGPPTRLTWCRSSVVAGLIPSPVTLIGVPAKLDVYFLLSDGLQISFAELIDFPS